MANKKAPMFLFGIVAIIIGVTLFKQFDFENGTFEKPALAIVYLITFVAVIYVLIKNSGKQSEK